MKRMFFLMLTLMVMGTAGMNAQVKIGGDGTTGPVDGAVLELDGVQGALLLPRFANAADFPEPTANLTGAIVYCTANDSLYTCNGTDWIATGARKATTTELGLVKGGSDIVIDADGTISMTSLSRGIITSLATSDKLRGLAARTCTTTANANGYAVGDLCWAPIGATGTWWTASNETTCPAPWRLPTRAELIALASGDLPAGDGFETPIYNMYWTSEIYGYAMAYVVRVNDLSGVVDAPATSRDQTWCGIRCVRKL